MMVMKTLKNQDRRVESSRSTFITGEEECYIAVVLLRTS